MLNILSRGFQGLSQTFKERAGTSTDITELPQGAYTTFVLPRRGETAPEEARDEQLEEECGSVLADMTAFACCAGFRVPRLGEEG